MARVDVCPSSEGAAAACGGEKDATGKGRADLPAPGMISGVSGQPRMLCDLCGGRAGLGTGL